LNPEAEHLLDWFHVTMRLTVLLQTAKGMPEAEPCVTRRNLSARGTIMMTVLPKVREDAEALGWFRGNRLRPSGGPAVERQGSGKWILRRIWSVPGEASIR
jgi:hypothetical protein